jgi:hypothetical protein
MVRLDRDVVDSVMGLGLENKHGKRERKKDDKIAVNKQACSIITYDDDA